MSGEPNNSARLTGPTFGDIKAALLARLPELVREIAPGGKFASGYYKPKNPTRPDAAAGSFWVHMKGHKAGSWCDAASDDKGDVIDLVGYCKNISGRGDVRKWCLSWLGWAGGVDRKALEKTRVEAAARQKKQDAVALEAAAKNGRRAMAMFINANRIPGTVVDKYLTSRGIDLAVFVAEKRLPNAIRFVASQKHIDEDGVVTYWPCMVAAMCDANGAVVAVHRTWLTRDGSDKAPVKPAKKMWPAFKGCVIRLAKGDCNDNGKFSPEQAGKRGLSSPVVICEGIEDGLSISQALPVMRIWAAGTLGNMVNVPNLPCVSSFIIAADNDAPGSPAAVQLEKVLVALRRHGKPVEVVRAPQGKDFNDLLSAGNQEN